MQYKFQINNILYTPRDGFVVKEELNETLDSGLVMLSKIGCPIDIQPYDVIKLIGDETPARTFLVDNFNEDKVSFTPNEKYEYTINLFSETKGLERITLPNLTITQNLNGLNNRSIWYYFSNYVSFYGPKIRVRNPALNNNPSATPKYLTVAKYAVDQQLFLILNNIPCPEFQWNNPTLREVLNDLLGVANLIVAVRNNIITYFDITKRGNAIDESKLNNQQRMRGSADYVSDLNIEVQNAIGQNSVKNVEYISFRQASEGILDDKNLQIVVQRPIYKINKIYWASMVNRVSNVENFPTSEKKIVRKVDITDYVKEKAQWEALEATTITKEEGWAKRATHKQANVYYTRGGNVIDGWGLRYSGFLSEESTFRTIAYGSRLLNDAIATWTFNVRDTMVIVEYESLDNTKVLAGKYLPIKNENLQTFDNQQNSFTDLQAQGILQYLKINRLSNSIITIYGEYKNENDVPKLSDTIGSNVLFSRELAYYDGYIKFKGMLTENYIITQWFTAVQSVKRSWQYAQASEAQQRYDVEKIYAEFSFRDKTETNVFNYSLTMPALFLSPFETTFENSAVKQALFYTIDENGTRIPRTTTASGIIPVGQGYLVDCDSEVFGNSIVLTFALQDNISAGNYVRLDGTVYRNDFYPYANTNGRNEGIRVRYLSYYNPGEDEFLMPKPWQEFKDANGGNDTSTLREKVNTLARRRPLVKALTGTNTYHQTFKTIYKDNREITKFSTQFEFCSDTPNIIFGESFVKQQRIVNENSEYNFGISGTTTITGGYNVFDLNIYPQSELAPYNAGNPATFTTNPTYEQYAFSQAYTYVADRENQYFGPYTYRVFQVNGNYYLYKPFQDPTNNFYLGWDPNTRIQLFNDYVVYNWEENKWIGYVFINGQFFKKHPTNLNRVYYSTTETFNLQDKKLKPSHTLLTGTNFEYIQITPQTARMQLLTSLPTGTKSWAVVDFKGNLLIGVNGDNLKRIVYLNFLTMRDNKVYWNQSNQTAIGDMQDQTFPTSAPTPIYDNDNNDVNGTIPCVISGVFNVSSGGGSTIINGNTGGGGGGSGPGGGNSGPGGGNTFTPLGAQQPNQTITLNIVNLNVDPTE